MTELNRPTVPHAEHIFSLPDFTSTAELLLNGKARIQAAVSDAENPVIEHLYIPTRGMSVAVSPDQFVEHFDNIASAFGNFKSANGHRIYPVDAIMRQPDNTYPFAVEYVQSGTTGPHPVAVNPTPHSEFVNLIGKKEQELITNFIAHSPQAKNFITERLIGFAKTTQQTDGLKKDAYIAKFVNWKLKAQHGNSLEGLRVPTRIGENRIYKGPYVVGIAHQATFVEADEGPMRAAYEQMICHPVILE